VLGEGEKRRKGEEETMTFLLFSLSSLLLFSKG
jgi:hypothetical protein